jgi:DNA-directed RNA polymerase subunit RPC12/RpoP
MTKLTCRTCGAKLELTDDIDRFSCSHCGNEFIVQRQGGIVSLKPVVDELEKISGHTGKTAAYSGATAENTDILAAEAKLKILRERIKEKSEIRNRIANSSVGSGEGCTVGCLSVFAILLIIGGMAALGSKDTSILGGIFTFLGVVLIIIGIVSYSSEKEKEDVAEKRKNQDLAQIERELSGLIKEADEQEKKIFGTKN